MENIQNEEVQITEPIEEEVVIIESVSAEPKPKRKLVLSYKSIMISLVVIIVLALLYIGKGLIVAATVDWQPVWRWTVINQAEKSVGKDTLDSLIRESLVIKEAKSKNIIVSDDEINEEINKIKDSLSSQSMTLDQALSEQGMTEKDLRKRIVLQKYITKLVEDKTSVSDEEVEKYIKDNSVTLTKGKEKEDKENIKEQLKNQKLSEEAAKLVDDLMSKAKINYWVKY